MGAPSRTRLHDLQELMTQRRTIGSAGTRERHHYEREFELAFLKKHGNAFQDLFCDVMERAYPGDFQRLRPHGNTGDFKCDGYLRSTRTVFQVYAPENFRKLALLLRKVNEDYSGAIHHWAQHMDHWVFVHNARAGLPAQVVQLLQDFRSEPHAPATEFGGSKDCGKQFVNSRLMR